MPDSPPHPLTPATAPGSRAGPTTCTQARRPGISAGHSRRSASLPTQVPSGAGYLDAGGGTGEHVLMCAGLGLDASGVDLSSAALQAAEEKARDRGLAARFLRWDSRKLADLGDSFGMRLDCGLFHVFNDDDRAAYIDGLRSVTAPGSRYFMLCFSPQQLGDGGGHVRKVTQDEIKASFADGWRVDSIEPATIDITTDPDGVRAWLTALTRI